MRSLPPLNLIATFDVVGRHLSITKAADELCLTRSAVSKQISQLERQLGVELFVRRNRTIELTDVGKALTQSVRDSLAMLEQAIDKHCGEGENNTIVLRSPQGFTSHWLIPRLAAFQAQFPQYKLQFQSGAFFRSVFKHDPADAEKVDIEIVCRNEPIGGDFESASISKAHSVLVCSPGLLPEGKPLKRVEDLANYPWLHCTLYPNAWQAWLNSTGKGDLKPTQELYFDTVDAVWNAATQGIGIAQGVLEIVQPLLDRGQFIIPYEHRPDTGLTFDLISPKSRLKKEPVRKFFDWLRESTQ